jgi:predicted RND superfamily exporter protein
MRAEGIILLSANQGMQPAFLVILEFARRRRALMIAIGMAASAVGVWLVLQTTFDANVLRLLPRQSAAVRDFQSFLTDFGSLDHLYVEFDADEGIGEHADFVDDYTERLVRAPEIESIDAQLFEPGKDWNYLADRELYLLGADGAAEALGRFERPRLDAELLHARDLLAMPSPQIKAVVQQDPLGVLMLLRDRMQREHGLGAFDTTQEGYVSQDGRSRLIIVKPRGAPFDTDFCKALFARLSAVEAETRRTFGADGSAVRVRPAGAYRVSLEAEALIRRETIVNAGGSFVVLLVVMVGVFRTPWILVGGFAPMAIASILTLGINGRLRGALSPATSGSAGMLFGLGVDGVVLLYLRYVEERNAGRSLDAALAQMGGTASSVVLAQATTAATFLALLILDFPTLQDLGGLVGVGIVLCCVLTLLLLPGLLPRRVSASPLPLGAARQLASFVTRWSGTIVWVSLVITIALGFAARGLKVDTSMDRLQAQTAGARLEDEVAARFGLPRDVVLVLDEDADLEKLLEADERLQKTLAVRQPKVSATGVSLFLLSELEQNRVAQLIRDRGLTAADVEKRLAEAADRAGFRTGAFAPFADRLKRLLDPAERITFTGLQQHGLGTFVSRFVAQRGNRYRIVTYLYPQPGVDLGTLRASVLAVDPGLRLTGLPVINDELRHTVASSFERALLVGTGGVALLVLIVFRSARYTLLALVPTFIAFIWSAGLLALGGVELDLFSMFATVTFIGIAVDYGIYLIYRYLLEPSMDVRTVTEKTGAAIIVAGIAALIGFGSSVNSSYRPLHVFGIVSLVTLGCCIVSSLLLLPALVTRLDAGRPRRQA